MTALIILAALGVPGWALAQLILTALFVTWVKGPLVALGYAALSALGLRIVWALVVGASRLRLPPRRYAYGPDAVHFSLRAPKRTLAAVLLEQSAKVRPSAETDYSSFRGQALVKLTRPAPTEKKD